MQIYWHGFSCVRIESSHGEEEAVLVTDPYSSDLGLRFPRTLAPDIVTLSHQNKKLFPMDGFTTDPFVISDPGEYEVKGVFAYVMALAHEEKSLTHTLMYRFEIEGMKVGFLGGVARMLTDEELGRFGDIDILLLPVGGGDRLSPKLAAELVQRVEPRLVVPLYHQVEGIKEPLELAETFCKELGVVKRQDGTKLKITKKDLPAEDLVVAVLERA